MWKELRKYYNYSTREFVFPREVYLKYKNKIREDRTKRFWECRVNYEPGKVEYVLYKNIIETA